MLRGQFAAGFLARVRAGGATLRQNVVDVRDAARSRASGRTLLAACSATLLFAAIVHAAWLCEDSFITLRTVDNWVHGYGLRWNVAERVQSFTHPLWMLLVAAVYSLKHRPTLALLLPSLVATVSFLLLFARRAEDKRVAAALLLLLAGSKAFVEFSTSGLENPLAHLLLAGYFGVASHTLQAGTRLWPVSALFALLLVTRMDLLWLVAPSFLVAVWCARAELRGPQPWLALGPLLAWEAFSLFYYGFPVPNTAYAKLSTGVPLDETVAQGLTYLKVCLKQDPVSVGILALACGFAFASRRRTPILFAVGILGWVLYLVRIGGDFMFGRLLTPALAVAVLSMTETVPRKARGVAAWAAAGVLLASAALPGSPLWGAPRQKEAVWTGDRVWDERVLAYPTTGLFRADNPDGPRSHPWSQAGLEARAGGPHVLSTRSVGMFGYYAGPSVHIIDEYGLCDPLLARLPAHPAWSPGHLRRELPDGYLQTLESGVSQFTDAALGERYEQLASIVRGPLLSSERWRAIFEWNVRRPAVASPDYGVRVVPAAALAGAAGGGAVASPGVLETASQGLRVFFDVPTLVRQAQITVGSDDRYLVAFEHGDDVVWQTSLESSAPERGRLESYSITLPQPFEIESLLIVGRRGDFVYHVGRVAFELQ